LDWIVSFASAVIASCTNGDKLDVEEPRYDRALQVQAVKKTCRNRNGSRKIAKSTEGSCCMGGRTTENNKYAVAEEEELHSTKNTDITGTAHDLFYCS
jgi:hypothetical protein